MKKDFDGFHEQMQQRSKETIERIKSGRGLPPLRTPETETEIIPPVIKKVTITEASTWVHSILRQVMIYEAKYRKRIIAIHVTNHLYEILQCDFRCKSFNAEPGDVLTLHGIPIYPYEGEGEMAHLLPEGTQVMKSEI